MSRPSCWLVFTTLPPLSWTFPSTDKPNIIPWAGYVLSNLLYQVIYTINCNVKWRNTDKKAVGKGPRQSLKLKSLQMCHTRFINANIYPEFPEMTVRFICGWLKSLEKTGDEPQGRWAVVSIVFFRDAVVSYHCYNSRCHLWWTVTTITQLWGTLP